MILPRQQIQAMSSRTFGIVVLITTAGTWLGFANPFLHLPPLVLMFPAALAAIAVTARSPKQALFRGWLLGTSVSTACLYWIVIPVHHYGQIPLLLALPCPFLLGCTLGLHAAVYTGLLHLVQNRLSWPCLALFAASLWACLDILFSWILTGFPWLTLPGAISVWPWAVASVRFFGTFGLSGILAALALLLVQLPRHPWALCGMAGILLVLALPLIPSLVPKTPSSGRTIPTLLVQGGINQNHKWDPAFQNSTVTTYIRLTQQAAARQRPQLIVWPETAMPFYFQEKNRHQHHILQLVRQTNSTLVLGAPGYIPNTCKPYGYDLFNRAFLVNPHGKTVSSYDKRHLVPFGEYTPFASWLPFLHKLVHGVTDFSSGTSSAPLVYGKMALGLLICYEIIFPELAQKSVEQGANILVNISNDTWFGDSSAPRQHLYLSVLRAIEQNRFLLRCTNTGISAFIDNHGHILDTSGLFREQTLFNEAVMPLEKTTYYHDWYNSIHAAYIFLVIVLGAWAWSRKPLSRDS